MTPDENSLFPQKPAPSLDSPEHIDSSRPSLSADSPLAQPLQRVPTSGPLGNIPPPSYLPEDLRVPWGWTDLVLLLILAIAGFILMNLVVTLGLAISGVNVQHIQKSPNDINLLSIFIQVFLDLGLLAYLAAQMRLRFRSPFWHTIGWRKLDTGRIPPLAAYFGLILSGFFLSLIVSMGSALFPPKKNLPIETLFQDRYTTVLFMLIAVLLAPLVEETIFRGYIYPVVARAFGKSWGIIATGTLFGLLHAAQLWGGWSQIALLVFVGIVLTFARATSRTVLASFVIHTSYNSIQVIGLLIATHGLQHLPGVL
jgi:membrane protease YdiL (CAAX protease family)